MGSIVGRCSSDHANLGVRDELDGSSISDKSEKRTARFGRRTRIDFHIEELTRENIAAGMTATEARREALIAFGGKPHTMEECGRVRSVSWLDDLRQDFRFALHCFRRAPAFSITAVLTLAIGLGASTALFSTVNAALLKPLPYPNATDLYSDSHLRRDERAPHLRPVVCHRNHSIE